MPEEKIEADTAKTRVVTLLNSIMALPLQEQVNLSRAWQALADPNVFFGVTTPTEIQSPMDRPPVVENVITPDEWLASIASLSNREKLELVENALVAAQEEKEKRAFEAAIAEIKKRDIPLAVEVSVTRLAYDRPWLIVSGIAAVLLGIWNFGGSVVKFFSH
jgi:hypothetical protein